LIGNLSDDIDNGQGIILCGHVNAVASSALKLAASYKDMGVSVIGRYDSSHTLAKQIFVIENQEVVSKYALKFNIRSYELFF
jgi:hypothetical protein